MHTTFPKPRPRVLDKRALKLEAERQLRQALTFVRQRDGGKCRVCKKPGNQAHHIVYRSHGGTDEPKNLIYACADCHASIHAKVVLVSFNPKNPAKSIRFTRNTQWDQAGRVGEARTR